ncbi:type VI secretion system baseplate subunit TssK [Marinobacterium stanieri]|uniref:Type VI secretion system protein ImpJ n=1 Tax=Marinobacterium stanieri TaxID=49186 RepID=A0A1N6X1A3_9GAMM|nr:type VI secretion system baseplate subunit TssK [Marinobacterium stanieri]SIQ96093.1 type VI secretion system protein ImpJ [Marinobacterium stanieri]
MSWHRKVAWLEGMFIRPQHFQQQDRYLEQMFSETRAQLHPYGWGVSALEFDDSALRLGKVVIRKCRAIMPDGSLIVIPAEDDVPEPLELTVEDEGSLVYLATPIWRAGTKDIDRQVQADTNARYRISSLEVPDVVAGSSTLADIEVAGKKTHLLPAREYHHQFTGIPVARIRSVKNQSVELDENYVAPTLNAMHSTLISKVLNEVHGLTQMRIMALADRLNSAAGGGSVEVADFLLLQLLNRQEPLLEHYTKTDHLHPAELYRVLVQYAGELATFTAEGKKLRGRPVYQHEDLQQTFEAFEAVLQQPLGTMLDQNAIKIELEEKGYGIRVGYIPETESESLFVLCVRADMPREDLRSLLPAQAKIGPLEQITSLVNRQLPGVRLEPLPVAPRQIPYYNGAVYFELATQGVLWQQICESRGLALHIGSQFPGIQLELWAIK